MISDTKAIRIDKELIDTLAEKEQDTIIKERWMQIKAKTSQAR